MGQNEQQVEIVVSTIEREVFADKPSDAHLAELRDRWSGIESIGRGRITTS